jgi:hypothetical protein
MPRLRFPLTIAATAIMLCAATAALARVNIGAGTKFSWDNYHHIIMDYSVANTEAGVGLTSADYPSPRFGGNLQLMINRRFVALLTVDFGTYKHTVYTYPSGVDPADTIKITQKYLKVGVGLEAKIYLVKPMNKKAVPYIFLGGGKYFAKTETPFEEGELAASEMMSKLASPIYAQAGFGAEFIVNKSFSLGADIFGFRLEAAKGSVGQGKDYDTEVNADYYTGDQTYMHIYMYTALTFNFTFDRKSRPVEDPAPAAGESNNEIEPQNDIEPQQDSEWAPDESGDNEWGFDGDANWESSANNPPAKSKRKKNKKKKRKSWSSAPPPP